MVLHALNKLRLQFKKQKQNNERVYVRSSIKEILVSLFLTRDPLSIPTLPLKLFLNFVTDSWGMSQRLQKLH